MPQTHPTARSHASQNRLLAFFTTTLCLLALMAATASADASSSVDPQTDASGSQGVCAAVKSTVVTRNQTTVSLDLLVFTPGIRGSTVAAFLGPRLRERMCMPGGSTLVFGNSTRNNHTSASYVFFTVSAQCSPHGSPDCAVKPFNYLFNEFTDNARFVYDLYIDEVLIYNNTGTQASTCARVDNTPIYVAGPRLMLVLNFTGRWDEAAAAICMPLSHLDVTFVQPNQAEVRTACPNSNRSCAVKPFNALYGKRHDVASFGITAVLLVDLSGGSDSDSLDSEAASSNAAPDCSAVAVTPVFVWGPQLTLTLDAVSASSFDSDALRRLAAFACTQLHSFLVLYEASGRVSLVSNCGGSNINCAVLPFNFIRNSRHELHRFGIENARLSNTDGDGSAPDASGEWASSDAGSLSPDRCAEVARTTVHVHGSKLTLTLAMTSALTPSDAAPMRHALGALMCLDPSRFHVSLVGPRSVIVTPACPPTRADCASLPFNFASAHSSIFAHLGVSHVALSAVDDSSSGSSTHDLPSSHDSSSSSDAASAAPSICQMVRGTTSLFAPWGSQMYAVAAFETQQALSYSQWRAFLSRELCVPASMFDIRLVSTRKVYVTDTSGSADEDNTNNAKEDLPQRGANAAKAAPFGLPRGATSRRVQGISAAGKHGARDTNHVEREATNRRPELPLGVPQSGAPDKGTPRQGTSADIPAMSPQERAKFEASFKEIAAAGKKADASLEEDVDAGIERTVHEMYYHHSFSGTVREVVVRQYALLNRCPAYNKTCLGKPLSFLHKEISTNPSALPEIDWASVGLHQGDDYVGQCASIRSVVLPPEPIAGPVLRVTRWGWPSYQWKKDVGEALCLSPNEYTATIFLHPRPSAKHEVTDEMKDAENGIAASGGPATDGRGMTAQTDAPLPYSWDFHPKCSGGQCVVRAFLYASEYFTKHGRFPGPATLSVATVEFLYHRPATPGPTGGNSDSAGGSGTPSSSDAASAAPSVCQMVRGTTSLFAPWGTQMYAVAAFETQRALSYSQWRFLLSRELCVSASMFDIRLVSTRKVYVTDTSGSADEDNTDNAKEDLGSPQRSANAAKAAPFGLPRAATPSSRRVQEISAAGKHGARDTNHVEREATNRRPELARHPLGVPQSGASDKETPRQGTSANIPAMSPQERAKFEASFKEIAAAGKKADASLAEEDVDAGIERAVHEMYYHHSFSGTVREVVVRQYALLNRCPTYNRTCLGKPLSFLHKEISTNPSALPEIDWASVGLKQGDDYVGQCASIRSVVLPPEPIAGPVLRVTRWGWPSVQWKKDVGEALCLSPNEYTVTMFLHPRPSAKHEVTDEMKDADNNGIAASGGPATDGRGMNAQTDPPLPYSWDFSPKCSGGQCVVKAFLYASEYFAKHGRFPGPATLSVATVEFLHRPPTSGPDPSDSGSTTVCAQVRNHPTTVAGSRVYLRIRTTVSFADSQMAEWRLTFRHAVCASPSEVAITNEPQTGTIRVHQHCFTQTSCHEVLQSLNYAAARYWTLPPVLKIADAALFGGDTGNNGAAGGGDGGDDKFPKAAVIAVAVIAVVAVVAAAAFATFYVLFYRRRRTATTDDVEGDTDVEMAAKERSAAPEEFGDVVPEPQPGDRGSDGRSSSPGEFAAVAKHREGLEDAVSEGGAHVAMTNPLEERGGPYPPPAQAAAVGTPPQRSASPSDIEAEGPAPEEAPPGPAIDLDICTDVSEPLAKTEGDDGVAPTVSPDAVSDASVSGHVSPRRGGVGDDSW